VGEAVSEGELSAMKLGVELIGPPAIAGLVQVSADVEIDEARAERLPDKCTARLCAGDVLRLLTPGGGGWGARG